MTRNSEVSWQESSNTVELDEILTPAVLCDEPFQISDYMMLPDTATLSERLRVCLQEGDENPRDFTTLFDLSIYQLDTTSLPKVIKSVPVALSCTALHSECLV